MDYDAVQSCEDRLNALKGLITSTVDAKSWQDYGGEGTISTFDHLLVIAQTRKVQSEVNAVLAQLRARQCGRSSLVVDLRWVWLDAAQVSQLLGNAKPDAHGHIPTGVDRRVLEQLGDKAEGIHGRIECANGQLVHLVSGDRRVIAVGANAMMGGGYSPVVAVPNIGVVVELRAAKIPERNAAWLEIASTATRWEPPQLPLRGEAARPASQIVNKQASTGSQTTTDLPANKAVFVIDRPVVPAQQFATTTRVPLGQPVMIAGLTFAPTGSSGLDKPTDNAKRLYLFATVTLAADNPAAK